MIKPRKSVDVDIEIVGAHLSHVRFEVRTPDNQDLSAQDILDAVSQALVLHYPNFARTPRGPLDA